MKKYVIKYEREQRGWSLEYLGSSVGITKQSMSAIENGQNNPSYDVLVKLENLFHMSHRQLFAVVDDANSPQQNNTTKAG